MAIRIPINDVLNQTGMASCDSMKSWQNILQAVPLNEKNAKLGTKTQNQVNDYQELVNSVYTRYFGELEETQSARYTTSEGAKTSEELLHNITNNLNTLQDAVNSYIDEDIAGIISEYNEKLEKLKYGAKVKLMVIKANEINEAAKAGTSNYKIRGYSSENSVANHQEGNEYYYVTKTYKIVGQKKQVITYHVKVFKYIDYEEGNWSPLTCTASDVSYLEGKFRAAGVELPYTESGELVDEA